MTYGRRIINNVRYAYYRKLRDKAIRKMEEHQKDADATEWRKWAYTALDCFKKCDEIPIK